MKASVKQYFLNFKRPSGTSRGILNTKETWFLKLESNGHVGIGECAIFRGLSSDDNEDYHEKLNWLCSNIYLDYNLLMDNLIDYPSIQFGLETAFKSLQSKDSFNLFPSEFSKGNDTIPINGLVWMGDKAYMKAQIEEKINSGFTCVKLKIGALDFSDELQLLAGIRKQFSSSDIELRVDANGAFNPLDALEKLKMLSEFDLHSIEQPIKSNQLDEMAKLCELSPIDIALDEELIGLTNRTEKIYLLKTIQPQYIILKPALVGGFQGSEDWIDIAEKNNIGWWVTSALESNIGLNAIAQWTYTLSSNSIQGLGTGGLFTNNFDSPLTVEDGRLHYKKNEHWNFNLEL